VNATRTHNKSLIGFFIINIALSNAYLSKLQSLYMVTDFYSPGYIHIA